MIVIHLPIIKPNKNTKTFTLPETNRSSLKIMLSNRNLLFQGAHIFRCYVFPSQEDKAEVGGSTSSGMSAIRIMRVYLG